MRLAIIATALLLACAAEAALFRSGPVIIKNLDVESFDVSPAKGKLPDLGAPGDPPRVSVYVVRYSHLGKLTVIGTYRDEMEDALIAFGDGRREDRGHYDWIVELSDELAKAGLKARTIGIPSIEGADLSNRNLFLDVELDASGAVKAVPAEDAVVPLHVVAALDSWKFEPPPAEWVGKRFILELPVNGIPKEASDLDSMPTIVRNPKPEYPRDLRLAGIEGRVDVVFTVGIDGKVESAYIAREDHPAFNAAVLAKIWDQEMTPGLSNGKPARFTFRRPFSFRIDGGGKRIFSIEGSSAEMPEAYRFDVAPEPRSTSLAVYPHAAIIERRTGSAEVLMLISEDGRVIETSGQGDDPEFVAAAVAAVEASSFEPAKRGGKNVRTLLNRKFRFSMQGEHDTLTTMEERGIATLVRRKSINLVPFSELNKPVTPLGRHPPVMPLGVVLTESVVANVEVIIDEEGKVNLPRVINQIDPRLAASAVHALKRWTFQPPMKGGKTVMTKVVVPVRFSPPKPKVEN